MTGDRAQAVCELTHQKLFERTLPGELGWALEVLFEIDEQRSGPSLTKGERREKARALYQRLEEGLGPVIEPTPPEHRHEARGFRGWFVEALLLWIRFGSTGSTLYCDTVGAETLEQFPVDLPPGRDQADGIKRAARLAFSLTPEDLAAAEEKVLHLTSNLELKRRIARSLADYLAEGDRLGPEGRLALMREFYGSLPFRPGDVDIVIASTAIFFFVPRKGSVLELRGFAERPEPEREAVREFLGKVDRANTAETRRFPSFGLCEPEALSAELVARLSRSCGASESVIKATLVTMFSLIPRSLHAQYLVHDLWGHTWQEALSEFEWEYALVPSLDRPLGAADGPEFGGADAPTLASAFRAEGGRTVLDERRLLAFGDADLRGRIQVATSVPLSEVLADFMESKFSRARPALELPTSSLIPSTSLKIDLTIADARTQIRRYAAPYRKLAVDPEEQRRLAAELAGLGLPEAGLAEAVARAGRLLWLEFQPAFDESIAPEPAEPGSGALRGSVLRRLLLQFALVMVDLERALGRVEPEMKAGTGVFRDPKLSADLLAVALTHFYEQDRQKNFWHLDQMARNEFEPACDRVRDALG